MIDRLRPDALSRGNHGGERYQLVARGLHVQHRQRGRILLVLRRDLQHDLILVIRREDLRDLTLAVGRRQSGLHLIDGQAQGGDLLAIQIDGQLGIPDLKVGVDVEQPRNIPERSLKAWRDAIELLGVRILERKLILRTRLHAANADGRRVRQHCANAGNASQLGPQLLDDLVRRQRAFVPRLEIDVQAAASASSNVGREGGHVRVGRQDGHHFLLVRHHGVEADALDRLDLPIQLAGVDGRNESGRDYPEEIDRSDQKQRRDHHRRTLEPDGLPERPGVASQPRIEQGLDRVVDASVAHRMRRLEEAAAQHRRQRQRHDARNEDRSGDRHRELVHQASDDAAHEEDRDEDSGER